MRPPAHERLMARVAETPGPLSTPCWVVPTSRRDGYGTIADRGRQMLAHVFKYEWHNGPVPTGLQVDHLCFVRACINPSHLEAVTQAENIRRSRSPGAVAIRTGKCKHGHSLADAFVRGDGSRACRGCNLVAMRRRVTHPRTAPPRPIADPGTRLAAAEGALRSATDGLTRGELAQALNISAANAGNCLKYLKRGGKAVETPMRRSRSIVWQLEGT